MGGQHSVRPRRVHLVTNEDHAFKKRARRNDNAPRLPNLAKMGGNAANDVARVAFFGVYLNYLLLDQSQIFLLFDSFLHYSLILASVCLNAL